jgi:hypothetical protein
VSLADSLFFGAAITEARPKVLLYLVITMAPFALVAPVIGPFVDRTRGGRRLLFAGSMIGRATLALMMAGNVENALLYPLAFGVLVLSKGQSIAKSALVPAVVADNDELVRANSRLAIMSIGAGTIAAPIAASVLKLVGAPWVLRLAGAVFVLGTLAALRIPRSQTIGPDETQDQRAQLHVRSIVVAGSAMGLLRGVVGFFTFFAAFTLKKSHEPAWMFGVVLVGSAIGNGVGTLLAPLLRRKLREEWILAGTLLVPAVPLIYAARSYGRVSLVLAAFSVAASAACGRVAFDSLVQRDGADAARGRAFARFETRFQLLWVTGGVVAVLFPAGGRGGIFLVALVLLFVGLSYVGAVRRSGTRTLEPPPRAAPPPTPDAHDPPQNPEHAEAPPE